AALKLAVTHCGLDVGEDGKTHQCIDYVGAFREMFGWRVIVPADPNQTDRAVRAAAAMQGNVCVAMGRSKLPVLLGSDGVPLFAGDYRFEYGRVDWAREGEDGCLLAMGTVAGSALAAADEIRERDGASLAVGIVACPLHLDGEAMMRVAGSRLVITAEDHGVHSGLGASVAIWLARAGAGVPLTVLGVSAYQSSGAAVDVLRHAGLDRAGIVSSARKALGL
ncbi:MAG: transketolase, partial [Actinobacteria bacterium]